MVYKKSQKFIVQELWQKCITPMFFWSVAECSTSENLYFLVDLNTNSCSLVTYSKEAWAPKYWLGQEMGAF